MALTNLRVPLWHRKSTLGVGVLPSDSGFYSGFARSSCSPSCQYSEESLCTAMLSA